MDTPAEPRAAQPRPDKDLLTAWMLLLLDEGVGYGYKLRRELEAHGLDVDAGAMYRRLRQLEGDGCVQSRWQSSSSGPQRRAYRLTRKGRRARDDAAEVIAETRDTHDVFLQAYARRAPSRRSARGAARAARAAAGEPQAAA